MPSAARAFDKAAPSKGGEGGSEAGPELRSPDVIIDNQAALYLGDPGPGWQASEGSTGVFINGRPALRRGDETKHDGKAGEILQGSPDVVIGDRAPGAAALEPHDRSSTIHVTDGLGRPVQGVTVSTLCPHDQPPAKTVDGSTTVSGLCPSSTVRVDKTLQTGTWDAGATRGPHPQSSTRDVLKHAAKADTAKPDTGGTAAPSATPSPTPTPSSSSPTTTIHAPAPSTSSSGGVSPYVPTGPGSTTTNIVLPTTHNWVELVYEAFGQHIPTGPMELALLGVRGASLGPAVFGKTPSEGSLEADAAAGKLSDVEFTTGEHEATAYGDLLFCVWTDSNAAKTQFVDVFECTIDASPGKGTLKLPYLVEGTLFHAAPGSFGNFPGDDVALHVFEGKRESKPPKVPTPQELIAVAMAKRGYTENPPDSNNQMFGIWYGDNYQPWCAMFVSWCFDQIGMPQIRYEGCSAGLYAFQHNEWGRFIPPNEKAEPGDIVFYLIPEPDAGSSDHTGIVVNDAGSSINTIEGNTSAPAGSGSQSNGGGVFYKNRLKGDPYVPIVGYGRPNWPPVPEVRESVIRWGSEKPSLTASSVAGSTVLHHHYFHDVKGHQVPDPAATRYRRFMQIFNEAKNKKAIPYLVVSSNYVTSYAEWATTLPETPNERPTPSTVIHKAGLVSPEGYPGRYIPSFMSKAYATKVAKEVAATHDPKKAESLRAAFESALFKLARGASAR